MDRKRIVFYDLCSSAPRKISGSSSSPFTKELAHPPKKQKDEEGSDEKGGGFAEGYGDVDSAELSALLAADEEFNASLDLAKIVAEDELNRYEHIHRIKVCHGQMAHFSSLKSGNYHDGKTDNCPRRIGQGRYWTERTAHGAET